MTWEEGSLSPDCSLVGTSRTYPAPKLYLLISVKWNYLTCFQAGTLDFVSTSVVWRLIFCENLETGALTASFNTSRPSTTVEPEIALWGQPWGTLSRSLNKEQVPFPPHLRGTALRSREPPLGSRGCGGLSHSAARVLTDSLSLGDLAPPKWSSVAKRQREAGKARPPGSRPDSKAKAKARMAPPCLVRRKAEDLPSQPGTMKSSVPSHVKSLAMIGPQLNWHIPSSSSSSFPSPHLWALLFSRPCHPAPASPSP